MSKTMKFFIAVAIFNVVAFLVIAGFSPVFAAETTEEAGVIQSALDWIKSLSVEQVKGWIKLFIAFVIANSGTIILLVIKIAYDAVKKDKNEREKKEIQTKNDEKIINLENRILAQQQATQENIMIAMGNFAKKYDIKLQTEVSESVSKQKEVLDEYANKIKEIEAEE